MVQLPVPNTVKVAYEAAMLGEAIVNTLHFTKVIGDPPTPQNVLDITAASALAWRDSVVPTLGSQYDYVRAVGTDLSIQGGFQHTETLGSGAAGGDNTGLPLPNSNAFCVTLRTGFSGRSARGRCFLPALRTTFTDTPNTISTFKALELVEGLSEVIGNIEALTEGVWRATIVSRFFNKAPRLLPITYLITSVGFSNRVIDSQDRRMPK